MMKKTLLLLKNHWQLLSPRSSQSKSIPNRPDEIPSEASNPNAISLSDDHHLRFFWWDSSRLNVISPLAMVLKKAPLTLQSWAPVVLMLLFLPVLISNSSLVPFMFLFPNILPQIRPWVATWMHWHCLKAALSHLVLLVHMLRSSRWSSNSSISKRRRRRRRIKRLEEQV